jgi:coenzyme F420-reducing hydrogenase alpha subunit
MALPHLRHRDEAGRMVTPALSAVLGEIEQLIRSYEPCISCATHFLDVEVENVQ